MKIIEQLYAFKTVEYFGHNLIVPNWTKYLACDSCGDLIAFKNQPQPYDIGGWWEDRQGENLEVLGIFSIGETDWKDTLVEVK